MQNYHKHKKMIIVSISIVMLILILTLLILTTFWKKQFNVNKDLNHFTQTPSSIDYNDQHPVKEVKIPKFWDIINLPYEERDQYLVSFASQSSISSITKGIEEYRISTLRNIFDPKAPLFDSQFLTREENDYDQKIIYPEYQATVYSGGASLKGYQYLKYYMVLRFKSLLSIELGQNNNEKFNSIAIYILNDELYISLYQDEKYIKGYKISESYYKNLIIESEAFITKFINLTCSKSPDC